MPYGGGRLVSIYGETGLLPAVVDQVTEGVVSVWLARDAAVDGPNPRLADIVRLDERLDAYVDALRIAGHTAWAASTEAINNGDAGAFFAAGVITIEGDEVACLDELIVHAMEAGANTPGGTQLPGFNPWRGLISAFSWVELPCVAALTTRLIEGAWPRMRWLGVAASGAQRNATQHGLEAALEDRELLVRTRACRTVGQLGRADLLPHLIDHLANEDPECRFWAAWAAARMGATEALNVLADIAWQGGQRSETALELLLRRLEVGRANAWLRELARIPERKRSVITSTGVIGDTLYIPWLIDRMATPGSGRLAGEAFSMITGVALDQEDFAGNPPANFQSGPNDDPEDENVALDEDDRLPWPDPAKVGDWWTKNKTRFNVGTAYFLGKPKASADWLEALSNAFQRQRRAAALELAIRQPNKAMFEVRARGRLQRQLIARARGEL
jgi:uncharacterized protein (TIGR02270 family)